MLKVEDVLDPGMLESGDDPRVTSVGDPAVVSVEGGVGKSGICC